MARQERTTDETPRKQNEERGRREDTGLAARTQRGELVPRGSGSPFSLFQRMFADMDRIFEDFGLGSAIARPSLRTGLGEWAPQIEAFEREGKLVVRADLPGVKQEDLKVRIDDDVLYVSGERRSDRTEEREGYWRSERSYGSFQRAIPLPPDVDVSTCDARFENGVLEVEVKLPEGGRRGRDIPIGRGGSEPKKVEAKKGDVS